MLSNFNLFKALNQTDENKGNQRLSYLVKSLITLTTIVLCSFFYILRIHNDSTTLSSDVPTKGFIWTGEDIVAHYSFPLKRNIDEYREDINNIQLNSYLIFDKINNVLTFELKKFDNIAAKYDKENQLESQENIKKINAIVKSFIQKVYQYAFIDIDLTDINNLVIYSYDNKKRSIIPFEYVYDLKLIRTKYNSLNINQIDEKYSNIIISEFINSLKPNHIYNKNLTENEIEVMKASVPKTNGFVSEGEILIRKGDKITDEHILKLQSYRSSLFEIETKDNKILVYIGSIGHFILVFSFLLIYIFKLKQDEFYDNTKYALLCSFLVIVGALSYLSISISYNYPMEYFITIPAFSMLAVMLFDFRTAFYLTVTMSLMAAGIRGNDYTIGITMMFAGILAIYSIRNIKDRSQLYKSIFFIFIGFFIALLFLGLERNFTIEEFIQNSAFAAVNSAISPVISFGLLYIIEKLFSFTSALSIEEFDDLNNKIMKELNDKAGGTYAHSIAVANLASKCAEKIGADSEFCKVACYYHDIGKITKPEYFIENVTDGINKHDATSPYNSASIIIGHVTTGVEIAKKNKLPESIIKIIKEHHGTTVLNYFYQQAVKQDGFENVKKEKFQYSGPIPSSRESGIIMICDQVEAISRLPEDKRPANDKIIDEVIENMLNQEQLDNANLTIKDLKSIKQTLIGMLQSEKHKRIEYKDNKN
jgi:putative nucleotidyltransferase with HDIG domain